MQHDGQSRKVDSANTLFSNYRDPSASLDLLSVEAPLSAALCYPGAAAGSVHALASPNAAAAFSGEAAGAVGPLATGPNGNPHEPHWGNPSLYGGKAAVVDD
jgi:hypothetical protein